MRCRFVPSARAIIEYIIQLYASAEPEGAIDV